ncbi:MAG: SDR family oxidoreductase [Sphingomonadales bacterium]|nr:SDR family oxidoreductase [Sphingomonadales bacterium]
MSPRFALVAGGGSGIGRGCALQLAAEGWHVTVLGRDAAKLEAVAAEAGDNVTCITADARDWDRVAEVAMRFAATGIDLLINSVGGQFAAPSAQLSHNGWRAVTGTNLDAAFFLARHFHAALAQRRGAIVNVVADIWRRPAPGLAHSAAARAGVVSLTRTLALEWAAQGIRVNAVSPGLTDTPALRAEYRSLAAGVPLGRIGSVADMVDAIIWLAGARYVTGEVLTVDGGLNLAPANY